jgi:cell division protein FtsB
VAFLRNSLQDVQAENERLKAGGALSGAGSLAARELETLAADNERLRAQLAELQAQQHQAD